MTVYILWAQGYQWKRIKINNINCCTLPEPNNPYHRQTDKDLGYRDISIISIIYLFIHSQQKVLFYGWSMVLHDMLCPKAQTKRFF